MPAPLNPNFWASILHDEDGAPISASNPLPVTVGGGGGGAVSVKGSPGTTIATDDDVVVNIGATATLGAIPAGTRRFTVQNTGPAGTWVRVREAGGSAGAGQLFPRLGQYTYGGGDGAIAQLEVEDVSLAVGGVAVATTIAVQYEED